MQSAQQHGGHTDPPFQGTLAKGEAAHKQSYFPRGCIARVLTTPTRISLQLPKQSPSAPHASLQHCTADGQPVILARAPAAHFPQGPQPPLKDPSELPRQPPRSHHSSCSCRCSCGRRPDGTPRDPPSGYQAGYLANAPAAPLPRPSMPSPRLPPSSSPASPTPSPVGVPHDGTPAKLFGSPDSPPPRSPLC